MLFLNHLLLVFLALLGLTLAGHQVPILKQSQEMNQGQYKYAYETDNGIAGQEIGEGGKFAAGNGQWVADDGTHVFYEFTADKDGYRVKGSHVPEIPEYIQRSLDYIRAHPPKEI
ncbi:pupal cuticle protein-like [Phlebotomus papatasi]|nr:pupal cuticle protein-like [Phlebotomus papatasi]